jgi:hypothetical protein
MGVAMSARVLGVCLVALPLGATADEVGAVRGGGAVTVEPDRASATVKPTAAAAATSTPNATLPSIRTPTPTAPPASRSGTAMASATSTATSVPTSPSPRQPPPAVLMVPLLGGVILPVVVPTAVPHPRHDGRAAEERKP